MTDQVTSVEQSKRLIEMGVPAEKASMVWATCSGKYHLSVLPHYKATPEYIKSGESIPALTQKVHFTSISPNVTRDGM